MYSTCLFCAASLGHNEAIETFPVGRRLAFDAAKGRLWVVCRSCERWNLTPLEERWEAVEACEASFRATRLRASSGEIGLARLGEGLELVRIGVPHRPEMAAWRYGDQFGRRTRRNVLLGAGSLAAMGAVLWGGPAFGLYAGGSAGALNVAMQAGMHWNQRRRTIARVVVGEGSDRQVLPMAALHVRRTALQVDGPHGWALDVPWIGFGERITYTFQGLRHVTGRVRLEGEDARRALSVILPHVNRTSGAGAVRAAVATLELAGSPDAMLREASRATPRPSWSGEAAAPGNLARLPAPIRLALEMAVHEESERRALEGELSVLAAAWREAEEIAGIADALLLPPTVAPDLARLKRARDADA